MSKPKTPEQKRAACTRAARRHARLKAQGLCQRCAGNKTDSRIYCGGCRYELSFKQKQRNQQRKTAGLCIDCMAPAEGTSIFCLPCKITKRDRTRQHYLAAKKECYERYGGYRCSCCGETNVGFLTLDHINNDGKIDRQLGKERGGYGLYIRLRSEGFPPGFAVMCFNCNCGRAHNNYICPHKEIKAAHLIGISNDPPKV